MLDQQDGYTFLVADLHNQIIELLGFLGIQPGGLAVITPFVGG